MTKPTQEWRVLPHGPLTEIDDGIHCVVGEIHLPLVDLPRRMTVVRLAGGRTLVWSAISVDDATLAALEALGRPTFLVVPSDHHRLDAGAWKVRYPQIQVVTPPGSLQKTAEAVEVSSTDPGLEDPDVDFMPVPGTRDEEAALLVRRASGTTLIVNDIIGNVHGTTGFGGWVLRRMGLAGDHPQVPGAVAMMIVKDRQALRAQLAQWADRSDLRRVIVAHGDIIEQAPGMALRDLAQSLD